MCTSHKREYNSWGAQKQNKFDLHVYFDVVKIDKNRKCASCSGGEHGFEKQVFDASLAPRGLYCISLGNCYYFLRGKAPQRRVRASRLGTRVRAHAFQKCAPHQGKKRFFENHSSPPPLPPTRRRLSLGVWLSLLRFSTFNF